MVLHNIRQSELIILGSGLASWELRKCSGRYEKALYFGFGARAKHEPRTSPAAGPLRSTNGGLLSDSEPPKFKVLALAEAGGHHLAFTEAAKPWLKKCGEENGFEVDYIQDTTGITKAFLAKYRVVLQLDFVPYGWKPEAKAAFKAYIEEGKGGWVGLHHATLLGDFDGQPMWPWFSEFMGKIKYQNYIPTFASGTVRVEDKAHPCMKGCRRPSSIPKEEWYTYDRSPARQRPSAGQRG